MRGMELRHPSGLPPLCYDWARALPRLLVVLCVCCGGKPRPPRQAAAPQSLRDHLQGLALQACPGAGWNGPADSAAVTVRRARRWALRRLQHGPASFPRLLTAFLDHLGQAGRGRGPCSDTVDVLERSLELLISDGRIACRGDLLIHRQ